MITSKMHCINLYFECTVEGKIVLNDESGKVGYRNLLLDKWKGITLI